MTEADAATRPEPLVVFLAHATDRTGPPRLLLQQLRWLHANTAWRLAVVSMRGGDLLAEFEAVASVFVVGEHEQVPDDPAERARAADRDESRRAPLRPLAGADLVYVNTAWSIHLLKLLPERPDGRDRPMISAVHELDHDLRHTLGAGARADLLGRADHILAGAEVIARNLVDGHGVPPGRITVVTEAIEIPDLTAVPAVDRVSEGISADAFVVTTVGSPIWRKAPDLFVHLAWRVSSLLPDRAVRFRWIGADPAEPEPDLATALADRERLGLEAIVEFVPPTSLVFDHLRLSDVFVLTSREDASPLVCLEAGAVGLPVVCFATGGTGDNLGPEAVSVVPYPDVPAMAAVLADLARNPDLARERGQVAQDRVRAGHDITRAGAQLADLIGRWLR